MSTEWVVTTATERMALNEQRQGETTFTVTNPASKSDRAVFEVVPSETADPSWFTIDEPQRLVRGAASVSFLVKAAVPAAAASGEYTLQGRVYSTDSAPEESSVLSNRVLLQIAPAPTPAPAKKPWWLLVVIGLVVLVLVVVVAVACGGGASGSVSMPDVSTIPAADVETVLAEAGLVATVRYRHQAEAGAEQSVPAGTEVDRGSTVEVIVNVALQKPTVVAPKSGRLSAATMPEFSWTQPEPYVTTWQVHIDAKTCSYFGGQPSMCNDLRMVSQNITSTAIVPAVAFTFPGRSDTGIYHTGAVTWAVYPVDDFGTLGPGSGAIALTVGA